MQRAKGAEPAAIGPTPPKQQGGREREPQNKRQRVEQKRLPREPRHQRAKQRHDVDHRQLRVGVPAKEKQRDRQEPDAEPEECALIPGGKALEKEHQRQDRQHCGQHGNFNLFALPDALPKGLLRALFGLALNLGNSRRNLRCGWRGQCAQVFLRQLIAQIKGGEDLFNRPDIAVHKQLDTERF